MAKKSIGGIKMIKTVILAAGEGTRMKSKITKVLHPVCGKSLVKHVIDAVDIEEVVEKIVILGKNREMVEPELNNQDLVFRTQPFGEGAPYGTGFAVMQALDLIEDEDLVLIVCGDTPLLRQETIRGFIKYHQENQMDATVLTTDLDNPFGYGRIVRDSGEKVTAIVEEKDADQEIKQIKEINSGIFIIQGGSLKSSLKKIDNNNSQNEYYLTDVIQIMSKEAYKVGGYKIADSKEINGINNRMQLAEAEAILRERINQEHMTNGVTFIDPSHTYIDASVKIGADTVIEANVQLKGNTIIGSDCFIGANTKIVDSKIADGVSIENSVIVESQVGSHTTVGPFAYLRPQSVVGEHIKIGDFVEIKNATIGDGTKVPHLSYVGDAEVGERCNIGCGVIFCNYDGAKKHKTVVGNHVFVGSNSNLVAPVELEDEAFIAAGSTITNKVENGDLAIARAKQVNKKGWRKKD